MNPKWCSGEKVTKKNIKNTKERKKKQKQDHKRKTLWKKVIAPNMSHNSSVAINLAVRAKAW